MTTKRKITITISWVLVGICMAIIFSLSNQVADESAELSTDVMNFVGRIFAKFMDAIGHESFRSLAHALEYFGLTLLLFNAFYHTFQKPRALLSFAFSVFYSFTDEVHQIFIEGRAFQFSDLAVDAAGSLAGVSAGYLIYLLIRQIIKHRRGEQK